ncbi:FAD-dependent monooxygenase [Prauserella muralis]|uniref:2-polyprenyl-6-methoxyphenol hydroxylase n=1 Tax=Prauserella muralis TaxID=588067 RepID=A0A2V4AT78_9PSEU|nr:FAD-dependent monooxygenase [Prauserella muralis]PXY24626.1 2-polyprenyl-6-methoxyphenol hydroxylase [Prauserella muralis]TWE27687.1 2-polyprenyl-6-methoxyphenol hydroxylase-like FAD-dependent oxidoreductase [Prauserella muralis]
MARTAAVVGGGIGGLTVAGGLIRAGWRVSVFERAEGPATTGTGLGIWPTALRALDRLGLGEAVRAAGRRQPDGAIRRPDGSRIATIDVGRVQRRQGDPVYLVSRPVLLGLLAGALPPGIVHYGVAVADPAALRAEYDLVIGADGIHSTVRGALFGSRSGLRYSGVVAWRGSVALDLEAGGETWGRGRKFGLTPQGPGCANWYATLRAAEDYRPPAGDLAELRGLFGDWHDPIPRVLERIEDGGVLRHGLHYLAPLPGFTTGNVALLGDAAHAMTPDLGQGACQAMIDAVVLTEAVAGADDLASALRRYDRLRRPPTRRLAAASLRAGRLSRSTRWLPARDLAIRGALALASPR